MQRLMLAGAVLTCLGGPARAFDFKVDEFASVFNGEAERENRTVRLQMNSCQEHGADRVCSYNLAPGAIALVLAGDETEHARQVVFVWDATKMSGDDFVQTPIILITIASPKASEQERSDLVHKLITPDLAAMAADREPVRLAGTLYGAQLILKEMKVAISAAD